MQEKYFSSQNLKLETAQGGDESAIDIYGDFYRVFRESPGMCRISLSASPKTHVDFFLCVLQ